MNTKAIDFKYLLLENYKKLRLSENEVLVIFMIDHLINEGNPFITADLLSLKMSLDIKELDNILAGLLKKKMIDYVTSNKKTATTLEPLKQKLYSDFEMFVTEEAEHKSSKKASEELNNIYKTFEKHLGRSLSPVEISKIREWVTYGYSEELIVNALKDAVAQNKKTIRAIDKILLSYQVKDDIQSEGLSTISEDWNKNLEETIKIAKTPWLDDDK